MNSLLLCYFEFMYPFLEDTSKPFSRSMRLMFKGLLRVMLVISHDFSDYLSGNYWILASMIPLNCVQLRNMVLAAFPKSVQLPDPYAITTKMESAPDVQVPPNISNVELIQSRINEMNVRSELVQLLDPAGGNQQQKGTLIKSLIAKVFTVNGNGIQSANSRVGIQSVLIFIATKSLENAQTQSSRDPVSRDIPAAVTAASSPSVKDLMQIIMTDITGYNLENFLNCIVDNLRYPSSYTHFYSVILLNLFKNTQSNLVKEQITRILVERVIAQRPNPWGSSVTFVELVRNPQYSFWQNSFTRSNQDVSSLFERIAASFGNPANHDDHHQSSLPMLAPHHSGMLLSS
eukprot:c40071_g1_i1.p1 GENE.c40071_g1_i1~~c40071_g1_i1.p1  ORF type:complete len:399 (+),score=12.31 c40071_g1_i1:162-1199(+)